MSLGGPTAGGLGEDEDITIPRRRAVVGNISDELRKERAAYNRAKYAMERYGTTKIPELRSERKALLKRYNAEKAEKKARKIASLNPEQLARYQLALNIEKERKEKAREKRREIARRPAEIERLRAYERAPVPGSKRATRHTAEEKARRIAMGYGPQEARQDAMYGTEMEKLMQESPLFPSFNPAQSAPSVMHHPAPSGDSPLPVFNQTQYSPSGLEYPVFSEESVIMSPWSSSPSSFQAQSAPLVLEQALNPPIPEEPVIMSPFLIDELPDDLDIYLPDLTDLDSEDFNIFYNDMFDTRTTFDSGIFDSPKLGDGKRCHSRDHFGGAKHCGNCDDDIVGGLTRLHI